MNRGIFVDSMAARFVEDAGKPYRPGLMSWTQARRDNAMSDAANYWHDKYMDLKAQERQVAIALRGLMDSCQSVEGAAKKWQRIEEAYQAGNDALKERADV
jgi:hypothetical protein